MHVETGLAALSDLETALLDVARVFDHAGIRYMLIGGMANAIWGQPRATVDVDLTVGVAPSEAGELLSLLGPGVRSAPPDPFVFAAETGVLPFVHATGIRVDLIFGTNAYASDALSRAMTINISGTAVRVCSPEDLILHKLLAGREKDRLDVESLLRLRRSSLDRSYLDPAVHELALMLEKPEIESRYLALIS